MGAANKAAIKYTEMVICNASVFEENSLTKPGRLGRKISVAEIVAKQAERRIKDVIVRVFIGYLSDKLSLKSSILKEKYCVKINILQRLKATTRASLVTTR
jgi:hypothetical protein